MFNALVTARAVTRLEILQFMTSDTHVDDGKHELRQMALKLARIVEIGTTLNTTIEISQLLKYILDTAVSLLECEAASIMLWDETQQVLRFVASTSIDPGEMAEFPVPLAGSVAGSIFTSNCPIVVNDAKNDPRHYAEVGEQTDFQVRSLVGVPMLIQERTTGVLEAINKVAGQFDDQDVDLLEIIATQAAVALHNANLVQALQTANQELSKVDQLKSNFMAVASHELRTPLGIILGYATFLKEEAQGDLSNHAESVLNAALRMQALVESMTNMNLLYTGAADLKKAPVEIQSICYEAYCDVLSTAEAQNTELILKLPKDPIFVNADPKLQLVFLNVLNNAVRFTPTGNEICIQMTRQNNTVLIQVADAGVGIPTDQLEKIFEQFYQVEDHMTRRFGGLGLGLSIARALVTLHGGKIWAESDGPGTGTTIQIVLPILA